MVKKLSIIFFIVLFALGFGFFSLKKPNPVSALYGVSSPSDPLCSPAYGRPDGCYCTAGMSHCLGDCVNIINGQGVCANWPGPACTVQSNQQCGVQGSCCQSGQGTCKAVLGYGGYQVCTTATCGDGVCNANFGETVLNCQTDCPASVDPCSVSTNKALGCSCQSNTVCSSGYCGEGSCQNPIAPPTPTSTPIPTSAPTPVINTTTDVNAAILRPNGAGNFTGFTTFTGAATHWQATSEVTSDENVSTVSNSACSMQWEQFNLQDSGLPAGTPISSIEVFVRARSSSIPTGVNLDMRVNGFVIAPSKKTTTSYANYSVVLPKNPANGQAWTVSDIDSLQAGAGSSGCQVRPYFTQVWVAVTTPAAPPPPSPTPISPDDPFYCQWYPWLCPTATPIATVTPEPICDPNGDGQVDNSDYVWWKDEFTGVKSSFNSDCYHPDRVIDILDFQVWKNKALLSGVDAAPLPVR